MLKLYWVLVSKNVSENDHRAVEMLFFNVNFHPCSVPMSETQVVLKINQKNQGNENLFLLYLIWWHTHTHTHIYVFSQLKLQKLWEKSYNSIKGLKSKYVLTAQPSFSSWRIKFLLCAYVINCKNAKTLLSFSQ